MDRPIPGRENPVMSPGRILWHVRRDLGRGWQATYHHYRTLPRISQWSRALPDGTRGTVPVHVLTGRNDWRLAAWMLASWFHFTGRAWPVVFHDDGTLPAEGRGVLQRLFPTMRLIARAEADAALAPVLRDLPFCADYRQRHPLALKVFDIPHFAESDRFFVFDSDLLFFKPPGELLAWAKGDTDGCWFNEDVREGSLLTAAEARTTLGIECWSRVNSGLCLLRREAIDLKLCDRALERTSILRGHIWRVEQTLLMLCAAQYGTGGLLPPSYEVSLGRKSSPDAVARHYVGAVRDRFYAEGLRRLAPVLLRK
jgi:hypothetical protein